MATKHAERKSLLRSQPQEDVYINSLKLKKHLEEGRMNVRVGRQKFCKMPSSKHNMAVTIMNS